MSYQPTASVLAPRSVERETMAVERPMRIGVVYPFCSISTSHIEVYDALTNVIYETARRLAADNEVIVYPRWQRGQPFDEMMDGFHVHRINDQLDRRLAHFKLTRMLGFKHFSSRRNPFASTSLFYRNYGRRVAADMARRGVEIVHVHCVETLIPVIRRQMPHAKIVLHLHDHALADYASERVRRMVQQADVVLSCSDFVKENVVGHYGAMEHRFHTWYNGVDQRYLGVESDPGESETISFVGRMTPEKGVDVLLDAFAEVSAEHPAARLELVGPFDVGTRPFVDPHGVDEVLDAVVPALADPRSYVERLEARMQQMAGVTYRGKIANAELARHYATLGAFVFPSLWHEPFGIPVIEAMAAGIPVIATRGGGLTETIEDGVNGFLVERGDVAALATALRRLLEQPDLRRRMGAAGRKRVRSHFTWDRQVEQLSDLYEDLLSEGSPTPAPPVPA
jgi:glycosyltransferase involved in cell wall biosynthesis